ncbi:MAG: HipA domain-containing protein [Proteobacteria bacterium]|nr:HipA domain-containing protein [Pseudomonadota bacterium]
MSGSKIARRGQIYAALPEDKRPRLSLAGTQDKCPVLIRDGNYFLPEGEAPSSHILKFELTDYRHLPAYETFTSHLAKKIGLPVVNIELQSIEKRFYAQIERYDRVWDERGEVQRLHQEDFCQALGYGHEKKYQDSGGPTFADCHKRLRTPYWNKSVKQRRCLKRSTVIIHHCSALSVLSHSNATVSPEFKASKRPGIIKLISGEPLNNSSMNSQRFP